MAIKVIAPLRCETVSSLNAWALLKLTIRSFPYIKVVNLHFITKPSWSSGFDRIIGLIRLIIFPWVTRWLQFVYLCFFWAIFSIDLASFLNLILNFLSPEIWKNLVFLPETRKINFPVSYHISNSRYFGGLSVKRLANNLSEQEMGKDNWRRTKNKTKQSKTNKLARINLRKLEMPHG